jgi:hypothetical protein
MKLPALLELEKVMMKEVVKRRSLGGYNSEAESVLLLGESLYKIIQHLIDEYPEEAITAATKKKSK